MGKAIRDHEAGSQRGLKPCLAPGEKLNQEPDDVAKDMRGGTAGWYRLRLTILLFHNFLVNLFLGRSLVSSFLCSSPSSPCPPWEHSAGPGSLDVSCVPLHRLQGGKQRPTEGK